MSITKDTGNYAIKVIVRQMVGDLDLDVDDLEQNPRGNWHSRVKAQTMGEAGKLALDKFHESVPISVLDDFDIRVKVRKIYAGTWGKAWKNPEGKEF